MQRTKAHNNVCPILTVAAVGLGVLSSRWPWLGDPVSVLWLFDAVGWRLHLVGERHDGCGGVWGSGVLLGVGEAVQVLAGGVDGAVDGAFSGATYAVLLSLVQVVGDTSFCTGMEKILASFSHAECPDISTCKLPYCKNLKSYLLSYF